MLRPVRRPPYLLLSVLGLMAGLLLAALLSLPRVGGLTPADGTSEASALTPISITFSQPMRADTVEGRLHLDPARPGTIRWSGTTMTFLPSQPWSEGDRVTITLDPGALSGRSLPTLKATRWSFTIGAGRLAYLWPADQPAGVYSWSSTAAEPRPLITAPGGILDFNLTRDGSALVYSTVTAGGVEIRLFPLVGGEDRLLYHCPPGTTCRSAALSTDGTMLVFLQEEPTQNGQTLRRVWAKALAGGDAYTVAPEDHATTQPAWSSQDWLVIYDQALGGYAFYDRVEPDQARLAFAVPNALGETSTWSPDGAYLVFAEMLFLPEAPSTDLPGAEGPPRYYSHLKRVSIADGSQVDLSGEAAFLVEDSGPAYSPDGRWIAFSRRRLDPAAWTLGRQLWVMRADGSEATELTSRPALNHAGLAWSSDATRLAYILFDQARASDPSELWWMWADGREGGRVVVAGYAPEWIP